MCGGHASKEKLYTKDVFVPNPEPVPEAMPPSPLEQEADHLAAQIKAGHPFKCYEVSEENGRCELILFSETNIRAEYHIDMESKEISIFENGKELDLASCILNREDLLPDYAAINRVLNRRQPPKRDELCIS